MQYILRFELHKNDKVRNLKLYIVHYVDSDMYICQFCVTPNVLYIALRFCTFVGYIIENMLDFFIENMLDFFHF